MSTTTINTSGVLILWSFTILHYIIYYPTPTGHNNVHISSPYMLWEIETIIFLAHHSAYYLGSMFTSRSSQHDRQVTTGVTHQTWQKSDDRRHRSNMTEEWRPASQIKHDRRVTTGVTHQTWQKSDDRRHTSNMTEEWRPASHIKHDRRVTTGVTHQTWQTSDDRRHRSRVEPLDEPQTQWYVVHRLYCLYHDI